MAALIEADDCDLLAQPRKPNKLLTRPGRPAQRTRGGLGDTPVLMRERSSSHYPERQRETAAQAGLQRRSVPRSKFGQVCMPLRGHFRSFSRA